MKQTTGIFACLLAILLLATGCAAVRTGRKANASAIVATELARTTRSWDGAELPDYPRGRPEVTIRRITVPAGARLEIHRHPVINAGMLLRGELTVVTVDGKRLHLRAGDPIVELVGTPHYGINEGQAPAEIVVVYAGAVGTPITTPGQ